MAGKYRVIKNLHLIAKYQKEYGYELYFSTSSLGEPITRPLDAFYKFLKSIRSTVFVSECEDTHISCNIEYLEAMHTVLVRILQSGKCHVQDSSLCIPMTRALSANNYNLPSVYLCNIDYIESTFKTCTIKELNVEFPSNIKAWLSERRAVHVDVVSFHNHPDNVDILLVYTIFKTNWVTEFDINGKRYTSRNNHDKFLVAIPTSTSTSRWAKFLAHAEGNVAHRILSFFLSVEV